MWLTRWYGVKRYNTGADTMNILVTGAKGMVGTALVNNLKNIRDNKNRTRPGISVNEIFE